MITKNRKLILILITVVALIVILAIISSTFFNREEQPVINTPGQSITAQLPDEIEVGDTTTSDKPRNYQKYDISQEEEHEVSETDLQKLAMSFSERLGSYSNQSNYGNFTDLKIFMTESMRNWADSYVENLKEEPSASDNYYGVVTKALTSKVKDFNEERGTAEIMVTVQKQENTATVKDNKSYLQNIDISLVEANGEWLVDKAYWQKK